jgi:phosphoglycerate dehydrogenase-like enzyme
MSRPLVAIVNSSSFGRKFPEHMRRLGKLGTVRRIGVRPDCRGAELARKLAGARVVIASVSPEFDEEFFRLSPDLLLVTRHGIGYDNVDVAAATRHGVMVARVPGLVEREAVAEHAVALMLAVMRRLHPADEAVRRGKWNDRASFIGSELKGRTVGIIGCGNIGGRVAQIIGRGFGARVVSYDPGVSAGRMGRCGAEKVPLGKLLAESGVISLHASLNPTSRRMLGARELNRMRTGVVIVNTARGELTDERALARAMKDGRVAGLGLDVVTNEPARGNHPLLKAGNVIMVPHIAAYTVESLREMGNKVVEDSERVLSRGRAPRELVNPTVLGSRALKARFVLPR